MAGLLLPPSTSSHGPEGLLAVCSQPSPSHSAVISPEPGPGVIRSIVGVKLLIAASSNADSSGLESSARLAGTCQSKRPQRRTASVEVNPVTKLEASAIRGKARRTNFVFIKRSGFSNEPFIVRFKLASTGFFATKDSEDTP